MAGQGCGKRLGKGLKTMARRDKPMPSMERAASTVARLTTDEAATRTIADLLSDAFDAEAVASALYEEPDGRWSLALHFRDPPDRAAVRLRIAASAGAATADAFMFETIEPKDWLRASLEGLTPVEAGRFVVHTAHYRNAVRPNRIGIEIEAALAFGTGHHGSTRGCLLALDATAKRRKRRRGASGSALPRSAGRNCEVLDLGTGSGVLAIAAAKALRRRVLASDIDARAVATARENARRNGVAAVIEVVLGAGVGGRCLREAGPFALILANILLEPLQRLATPLATLVAPGGRIVVAGLLTAQAQAATASYRARGLVLARRITLGGWATLVLVRPAISRAASRADNRSRSRGTPVQARRG
jgi:ribosomal protein L11 methyltransferase